MNIVSSRQNVQRFFIETHIFKQLHRPWQQLKQAYSKSQAFNAEKIEYKVAQKCALKAFTFLLSSIYILYMTAQ